MSRILFVIIPEKGHIHPYIGPAAALQAAGHEVAFYAVHDVAGHLKRAGFDTFFSGGEHAPPPPDANRGREFAERVRDAGWLRGWIKMLLVDNVPPQVEVLRGIIRRYRPDVLAIDPMVYQGAIAAELEGLPWAGLSSSLNPVVPDDFDSELLATNRWLAADRDVLFRRFGLTPPKFRVCDALSRFRNIVFSTPLLVGGEVPGVDLVGPSLPAGVRGDEVDFPWDRLRPGAPVVYMSLGSQIYHQPRMFKTVIEAVGWMHEAPQLVMSVGELVGSDLLGRLPDNVIAVKYAPQLQLLPRVTAMITHGGANSVMEAMTFGVPLLITPICNDQFHNARFIERSGVGIRLDLDTAGADAVMAALTKLIHPGMYRHNVERVRDEYRRHDGAAGAARLVAELAKK